jgi:hypothetical protein
MMKKHVQFAISVLFFLALLSFSQSAIAQTSGPKPTYRIFGGVGFCGEGDCGIINGGFGAEYFIYKGLFIGSDLGYMGSVQGLAEGFGNLNVNGGYHFFDGSGSQKWVPYLSGGYTLFFRESAANLLNISAGTTYWMPSGKGIRLEVRDQIYNDYETYHYVSFNFGFVF